jgi:exodeoxyribonuclease VII large subunit
VAVVSSPTGAALRDILNILRRRAPGLVVRVLPTPVQGDEAAAAIASRIEQANRWNLADVLIVGRGGGALEDLLPFSDEAVVRAVAASKIPVVSAVGHEIDWALSDFAADLRAPTPSAAAELVSENRASTLKSVRAFAQRLEETVLGRLEKARLLVNLFEPENMEMRFRAILQPTLVRFDDAKEALLDGIREHTAGMRGRLTLTMATLEAASPLAVLERGFSVVTFADTGKILRQAQDASPGRELIIRPKEGIVRVVVEEGEWAVGSGQ